MDSINLEEDSITVDTSRQLRSNDNTSQFDYSVIDPMLLGLGAPSPLPTTPITSSQINFDELVGSIELPQAIKPKEDFRQTASMHETLLVTMLDQCRARKRADSGFKKEAQTACKDAVQLIYIGVYRVTDIQIKSKLYQFKGMWKERTRIDKNSGFNQDESIQLYSALDNV